MMLKLPRIAGLFLLFFCLFPALSFGQYCAPPGTTLYTTFGCTDNDYIQSFSTSGGSTNISNLLSGCNGGVPGYTYFNQTHTAIPGDVVNFTFLITPTYSEGVKIWVDWNQNGVFTDPGEEVYASANVLAAGTSVTSSFTVPTTASIGATRMRVRCVFATTTFGPCTSHTFGEVEDYNFNVQSLTPCTGTPNVTASATSTTVCPNTAFTLQTQGAVGTGYTFQWQSSPACANTFTDIPGATTANFPVSGGITASTDYQVIVTCTNSGGVDTSNILPIAVACYCASGATGGAGADIGRIRIGNASYNYAYPATPTTTLVNNPASNNTYSNLTGTAPIITLSPGVAYSDTVTQINSGATNSVAYLRAFIDYNKDGDFLDPGENIGNVGGNTLATQNTFIFNFTVPATAAFGLTRMRKVLVVNGSIASVNSCGNYADGETEDYSVLIVPPAPVATANTPICANQSLNLTVTPTVPCAVYQWTGPSFSSNQQNPTITNPLPGTYTVTYTYYGITYGPASVNVAVGANTNTPQPVTICSGSSFTTPNGQVLTAAGSYPVTFTNVAGCDSVITYNVTVTPLPLAPTVTSPVTYCQNQTAIPLTATGTNLLWYTTPTGGVGTATAPTPATTTAGTTTYYVSQTVNGCEGPRAPIQVVVNPTPTIATATSTNPTTCNGTNGSISLTGLAPNTSYTVSVTKNGTPLPAVVLVSTAGGVVVINGLTAGTYSNISVTILGCVSNTVGPFTLTDPPTPAISTISSTNPTTCSGTQGTITLTGLTPSITYTVNFTRNGIAQPAQNIAADASGNIQISGLNAATYAAITVTVNNCISVPAGPVTLVDPAGPVITSVTNNGPLCTGQTLNLTATFISGASYSWTGPITSSQQNPSVTSVTLANAGTYTVTATVNGCTSLPVSTTVVVNQTPATPVITANTPICVGSTLNLSTSPLGGATYSWTGPNSFTSALQNPSVASATTADAGVYNLTVSANGCSSQPGSLNVVVNPIPAAPTASNLNYCQFATATPLSATASSGGTLIWYTVPTGGTPLAGAPTPSTVVAGASTWYVAQTVLGCESPRTPITVTIIPKPATPAVTTPMLYCQNEPSVPLTATGTNLQWYSVPVGGTPLAGPPTPSTATVGTTNYYVSQTVNGCESDRVLIAVIVASTPAAPTVSSPAIFCVGQTGIPSLATFVTGVGLSWYTVPTGGTGSTTPPTISTATTDTTTYYVAQVFGSCESPRTPIQVQVRALSPLPAVTNVTYCQFQTATALTATGTNVLWYTQPIGGPSGTPTAPIPVTAVPGTYTWYVTQNSNTCESPRQQLDVVVIPKPAAPTVVTPLLYCQNQSAVPLTAGGQNLLWYNTPTGGTPLSGTPTPITTTPGSTNYYVSQTVNGCESDRTLLTVTVAPTPTAPIVSNPVVFCQFETGLPLLTTYVTGTNLLWYSQPTGVTGSNIPPIVNTTNYDTINFYVSQTVGTCESPVATMEVQIRIKPSVPGTNTVIYCQEDIPTPLTANGQNLLWYQLPVGGPAGSAIAPTPSTLSPGTFTYYVSQTVNGCESDRTPILVTVKPKPAVPVAVTGYTYCQFDTLVPPLAATGTDILWYTSPSGGTGSVNAPTPSTAVPGLYYWYVTQTVNGCESNRLMITVEVLPKPVPPAVISPVLLCEGDAAAPLTAQGQNLKWYVDSVGFSIYPGAPVPNTGTVATLYYYVSQTVNGCESDRAVLVVQVNPRVYASIKVSENPFCQYDTIQIVNDISNNPSTASYSWNFGGGVILNGSGAGPYDVTYDTAGTTAVTLTVTNLNCSATDTKVLTVKPSPNAYFEIKPDLCKNEVVMVQASFANVNDDEFYWSFGGAQVILGSGPGYYKLRWTTEGEKIIGLQTVKAQCRSKVFYDTTTVHEDPPATITYVSSYDICSNDSVYLRASDFGPTYTYVWGPDRYFEVNGQRDAYARVQLNGLITLMVADAYGCVGRDSVYINSKSCCQAALPTAFSPNNDGRNDLFRIISPGHFSLSSFRIVNRWGQTVFETVNQQEGWDGMFMGKPQPAGSYYYYLRMRCADNEIIEQKGEFMLIR